MTRLFLTAIFVFFAAFVNAQPKLAVSYTDFVQWAKQINLAGYPFTESEQDGAEYTAVLASGPTKALQLRVADISKFDEYKMMNKDVIPYTWNGYKTVYFNFAEVTFLVIAVPEAAVSVTFGIYGKLAKTTIEELAAKTNLNKLKAAKAGTVASGVK